MFSVGDKIAYPMHGAGIIQKIEERKILGEKRQYYILKLPCSDIDVMIPVVTGETVGIRNIISKDKIDEVLVLLRNESSPMDTNWNRRYRENMDKLRTGDIMQVAEVVRNLMRIDNSRKLSAGERKMFSNAYQILTSEIILAGDMSRDAAEKLIRQAVFNEEKC